MKETYTAEEKLKLAEILTVEYNTELEAEDGDEISSIARKEVVTATDRLLEIKLVHSLPAAVSREGTDTITIKFDESIWDDP